MSFFGKPLQAISMIVDRVDRDSIKRFLYGNENLVRSKIYYIFSFILLLIIFIATFILSLFLLIINQWMSAVLLIIFSSPFLMSLMSEVLVP